jgi:hypothetical protein
VLGFFAAVALLGLGFQMHFALNSAPLYLRFAKPAELDQSDAGVLDRLQSADLPRLPRQRALRRHRGDGRRAPCSARWRRR